jgi:chromosome segregation ATPase
MSGAARTPLRDRSNEQFCIPSVDHYEQYDAIEKGLAPTSISVLSSSPPPTRATVEHANNDAAATGNQATKPDEIQHSLHELAMVTLSPISGEGSAGSSASSTDDNDSFLSVDNPRCKESSGDPGTNGMDGGDDGKERAKSPLQQVFLDRQFYQQQDANVDISITSSLELLRVDPALEHSASSIASPFTSFKRNSMHVAHTESVLYLNRIRVLEHALGKAQGRLTEEMATREQLLSRIMELEDTVQQQQKTIEDHTRRSQKENTKVSTPRAAVIQPPPSSPAPSEPNAMQTKLDQIDSLNEGVCASVAQLVAAHHRDWPRRLEACQQEYQALLLSERQAANDRLDEVQAALAQRDEKLRDAQEEFQVQKRHMNNKLMALEVARQSLVKELESAQRASRQGNLEMTRTEDKMEALERDLEATRAELITKTTAWEMLHRENELLVEEKTTAEEVQSVLAEELRQVRAEAETMKKSSESVISSLSEECDRLQAVNEQQNIQLGLFQDRINALQFENQSLTVEMQSTQAHCQSMTKSNRVQASALRRLERQLNGQGVAVSQYEAERILLTKERDKFQSKCNRLRDYVRKLTEKCKQWEEYHFQQSDHIERLRKVNQATRERANKIAEWYNQQGQVCHILVYRVASNVSFPLSC